MTSPLKRIGPLAVLILSLLFGFLPSTAHAAPRGTQAWQDAKPPARRLLMAHYMPWFQAKPFSAQWGWHWTMSHFDPDKVLDGRREAASRFSPLMGLYDSGDPDALRCQALLMKLSGIDGVIFDWYGNDDYYDYAAVNRNVERMIPILRQAGLCFAICYETQTIPQEIKGKVFSEADAVAHGQRLMAWMQTHFFASPSYLTLENRPVLLVFGDPYYQNDQWDQIFSGLMPRPLFFTESDRQEATASVGGFDWPQPGGGTAQALAEPDAFSRRAQGWPYSIAAAFPRFEDIYHEAGVGDALGHIDDGAGRTYEETLTKALQSRASVVQLVTWNDWGEGTQIEPSVEFGYRDLETTQRLRRKYLDASFSGTAPDLRLPVRWYLLCRKYAADPAIHDKLAVFFPLVVTGHLKQAQALLAKYGQS
jgi:hypothetical protein